MTATIHNLEMERFDRFESLWWKEVRAAIARHEDDKATHTMRCPCCGEEMEVSRRGPRMTFSGPEPACIQIVCGTCGFGGEI